MHPTWPEILARRCGARCYNFGAGGSVSAELPAQVQRVRTALASGTLRSGGGNVLPRNTLVVIHTGGNDFIQKIAGTLMGGNASALEILQPDPGRAEAENVRSAFEGLYALGARNFFLSGVPVFIHMPVFNFVFPIVGALVNAGQLAAIGVQPGDQPSLAFEVQSASLNDRWEGICQTFAQSHQQDSVQCVFFNEVDALHRIRGRVGDQGMWDMTMFHPSVQGHEHLATEAIAALTDKFPGLVSPSTGAATPTTVAAGNNTSTGSFLSSPANPVAASSSNAAPEGGNCKGGCGFFGSPAMNGYCSQCFKKLAPTQTQNAIPKDVSTAGTGKEETVKMNEDTAEKMQASSQSTDVISVHLRNVSGSLEFSVSCPTQATIAELHEIAIEAAPLENKDSLVFTLVHKNKILKHSADTSVSSVGIVNGDMIVVVTKPKLAS